MSTRVAVISDVHANLVALDAALADMPPVDRLVCAGDVVGYNPWPAECVAVVRGEGDAVTGLSAEAPDEPVPTVMGNHDRAASRATAFRFNEMAKAGVEHAHAALGDDALSWLEGLPDRLTVADGQMRLVHGHPDDPDRYTYPEDFEPGMLDDEAVLVTGHTHVQGTRRFDGGVVMNPGSVGQPRDGDPRAAYAVVTFDDGVTVDQRRVAYDVDRVVEAVRETGLPRRTGERLREGR